MWSILKREVRNYLKNPLLWIGIAVGIWMIFQDVGPYLDIHYLEDGERIKNDAPETYRDGDVLDGYVPTTKEMRRQLWEKQIQETLISAFDMDSTKAQAVIREMKEMDLAKACEHLENYGYYDGYYQYVNTAYHKGTREEINSYLEKKLERRPFSYYFARKFADFAGLFMGFFATVLLSVLFMQDTRKNTYELLHTKPVRAESYLMGKAGGGIAACLITLAALNLAFFGLCYATAGSRGFEVRLSDFLAATRIYILPNMFMIVSIYCLISLLFKNPLPGRPLAVMVRFPGAFFDTAAPPMALLNQSFLIFAAICMILISIEIWKRRRVY